jgi:hypothetical protein
VRKVLPEWTGLAVGLSSSRWSAFLAQLSQAFSRRDPVKGDRSVIVIVTVDRAKWCQRVKVLRLCGQRVARFGSERHQRTDFVRLSESGTEIR